MPTIQEPRRAIDAFAARYRYDMSYQHELLDAAPAAFEVFARAQGTSGHRRALPLEAHYVARIAMMQAERCNECALLNVRMALEAGVDRALVTALLREPERLDPLLRDVRDHVFAVSSGPGLDAERTERLRAGYGAEGFAELAVCLAGCRLFTTLKRSLDKVRARTIEEGDY